MTISIIVAVSDNGVIGKAGKLPWHLPDDLARFRELTLGARVLMGRKTYESLGKRALPGRTRLVLSRRLAFVDNGVWAIRDIRHEAESVNVGDRLFVVGGAEVYTAALPYCAVAYVTRVHTTVDGDDLTRFPCDLSSWRVVASKRREADSRHAHAFTFETLERP